MNINQLNEACESFERSVLKATERRDELITLKEGGLSNYVNDSKEDIMPTLIQEADKAVKIYQNILIHFENMRVNANGSEG